MNTRSSIVSVMLSEDERYWLAGLLEGEGTFLAGPPSQPRAPVLAVVMTDRDVVARVGALWERAVVQIKPRQPHLKLAFATRVKGAAAAAWMRAVCPLLGARRRRQIEHALSGHKGRLRWRRPLGDCSIARCGRRRAVRGLCRHHYKLWWKASRRGRRSKYVPVDAVPEPGREPDRDPEPTDPSWISWLAGLLEGEGTFASNGIYPVISAQMCDRDVLERAARLLGIARITPRDVERNRERGWSPSFQIAITGARAAEWMQRLRPSMGLRRAAAIDRALAAYTPTRLTSPPAVCVVPGCERPHRSRGLCHKHYMKWDRDRKAGKPRRITPLR